MFENFKTYMIEAGVEKEEFIKQQWDLMQDGVRDVRIHDATCVAWSRAGGKW